MADEGTRDGIADKMRNVLAIEMEGAGFSVAISWSSNRVRHLVIRGISDYGDSKKSDDCSPYAAAAAAVFARHVILDRLFSARHSYVFYAALLLTAILGIPPLIIAGNRSAKLETTVSTTADHERPPSSAGWGPKVGRAPVPPATSSEPNATFTMRVALVTDENMPAKCSPKGKVTLAFDPAVPPITVRLTPDCHADISSIPVRYREQPGRLTLDRACLRVAGHDKFYAMIDGSTIPVETEKDWIGRCECVNGSKAHYVRDCPDYYEDYWCKRCLRQ